MCIYMAALRVLTSLLASRPWADVADQAPVLVAITLPAGRVSTRKVGRANNQTTEDIPTSLRELRQSEKKPKALFFS
eukprot:scaffold8428_cov151-Skeletonema_menzelii.AAC.11